jgi:hypothetical protein
MIGPLGNAANIGPDAVGAEIRGRPRKMSLARVIAFSAGLIGEPGFPQSSSHTDVDSARSHLLRGISVQGTQTECHLIRLLIDMFGLDWYSSGLLDIRLTRPVAIDDVVTAGVRVERVEAIDDERHIRLQAWVENQRGESVISGSATVTVPDRRDPQTQP